MPDSQTLLLFLAATVAGIVCFRLFMVLGRRTGHEPTPPTPQERAAMEQAEKEKAEKARAPARLMSASGGSSGLVAVQLADRHFDISHFMAGAREAYSRITRAFAAGDSAALAPLVSPQVLAAFKDAIAARQEAAPVLTNLDDARIQDVTLEGKRAEITLVFRALFTGTDGAREIKDVWTFARDLGGKDPNWTLVATAPAASDGAVA